MSTGPSEAAGAASAPGTASTLQAAQRRRIALRLARQSFDDGEGAAQLLCSPPLCWWDAAANEPTDERAATIVSALGRSADPDAALRAVRDIIAADDTGQLRSALAERSEVRTRLSAVLGASVALAQQLRTHPGDWHAVEGPYDAAGVAGRLAPRAGSVQQPYNAAVETLRSAYRRELLAIAARDLAGDMELDAVTEALADLAGHTLHAAYLIARAELGSSADRCRLAIIAMGKTGGRELNYVSDVDVVFVAEPAGNSGAESAPSTGSTRSTDSTDSTDSGDSGDSGDSIDSDRALALATRIASDTMRICRDVAWEVDAALRPEGKDGPLVRTLASHEAYYRRWASTWEFQALLKARPVAGDPELGQRYLEVIAPMVWTAAERPDFVADVRAMRRRVLEHLPAGVAEREIKLGPGGLRDVEFAVQLLQLVHGRGDDSLRVAGTLPALAALRDGGYVGRDDALSMGDAYRFLRATEHRLQLHRLRRTHTVPDDERELRWLARALGYRPDARGDARDVFRAEWQLHAREVRRLHEKLFYRPLLEAVARVPSAGLRLTTEQARRRLGALGFADPEAALRHIEALTAGVTRRAALQRTLLPVLLADFADAPDPDRGLLAYRQVSDELGSTPWYLRLLRDESTVATRLAYLLGTSRYVARMVGRAPESLQLLADDSQLVPRAGAEIEGEMAESALRHQDAAAAVSVVRGVRRQELLRVAFADLLNRADVVEVCESLSAITEATVEVALGIAMRAVAAEHGLLSLPIRFAVIAMGRWGGAETGYGSDADVIFVFEEGVDDSAAADDATEAPESTSAAERAPDPTRLAQQVAETLRALLAAPSSSDPPLAVDAGLRPEGRNGPLVRSLTSYQHYYARWSSAWEAQALLRARFAAGDRPLGERFIQMIDAVRYPLAGISAEDEIEIRRLKARIDTERLPRGADPTTHTKLGRGGLADIEWTIQFLQLAHGHDRVSLRTPRTLEALAAAAKEGLLTQQQADALSAAWQMATRVRNALMLVRDVPDDQLPHQGVALVAVGRAMGYPAGFDPGQLVDDYRRAARRARKVVEDVFYAPR